MGGMVGQWLGANAANRIDKLILSNTACYYPDKTLWVERLALVRKNGVAPLAGATMERWFTKDFRERSPAAITRMTEMFLKTNAEGYAGCIEAIRDMDHRALLAKITAPTLVIAGRQDPATPLEGNEFIRAHIPGARIAVLEAAHIANVEQPQAYADTVLGFLLIVAQVERSETSRSRSRGGNAAPGFRSAQSGLRNLTKTTRPGRGTRAASSRYACGRSGRSARDRRRRAPRRCPGSAPR